MGRMPRIEETQLPGIGVRHDFMTRAGARVGVITHRTGRHELLIYSHRDPDACSEVLRLDEEEGHALADLLGGTSVAESVQDATQEIEGLTIDWASVAPTSAGVGQTLAEWGVREQVGATIVAVIRGEETFAAPAGQFRLEPGDTAVVAGTVDGVKQLAALLQDG